MAYITLPIDQEQMLPRPQFELPIA